MSGTTFVLGRFWSDLGCAEEGSGDNDEEWGGQRYMGVWALDTAIVAHPPQFPRYSHTDNGIGDFPSQSLPKSLSRCPLHPITSTPMMQT